jgi:hypothetical protein
MNISDEYAARKPTRVPHMIRRFIAGVILALALAPVASLAEGKEGYLGDGTIGPGEDDTAELARAVQNPVADLISVPFQNNTNFEFGPRERTQNVLNIQPVIPFDLTEEWLLITRTIVPVISQPAFRPGQDREDGLGDSVFTAFLSPKDQSRWLGGRWMWGAGPAVLLPTSTDDRLGPGEWGAGP